MTKKILAIIFVTTLFCGCSNTTAKQTDACVCESQKTEKSNDNIKWNNGIAYLNNEPAYFDPRKIPYPDLVVSKSESEKLQTTDIPNGYLSFHSDKCVLDVYLTKAKDRYLYDVKTKKTYEYQICNQRLWIRERKGNWEPITIIYVKESKESLSGWKEYAPCMTIKLKTKWFSREFTILCMM